MTTDDKAEAAPASASSDEESTGRQGHRARNTVMVTLATTVVGAVLTAFATGWVEQLFQDEPPPTCPGAACDGKNPQNEGCGNDAGTFKPMHANPASLEIRYSPECKAVWGRILAGEPGDRVSTKVAGGALRTAEIAWGDDQFTRMATVRKGAFAVTVCARASSREDRKGTWDSYCIRATHEDDWN